MVSVECDARIDIKITRQPVSRYAHHSEQRSDIQKSKDFTEQPGEAVASVSCDIDECRLLKNFKAEGFGPYGATNLANAEARNYIRKNCYLNRV